MATHDVTPNKRDIFIFGKAYSVTGDVSVKVHSDTTGADVFDGTVKTEYGEMPSKLNNASIDELITWQVDDTVPISSNPNHHGTMSLTVTGGDLIIVTTGANVYRRYTAPDTGVQGEYRPWNHIASFEFMVVKHDATIDGAPYDPGVSIDPDNEGGAWHYIINDGQTMDLVFTGETIPFAMPGFIFPADPNDPVYTRTIEPIYDRTGYVPPLNEGWMIPTYLEDSDNTLPADPVPIPVNLTGVFGGTVFDTD